MNPALGNASAAGRIRGKIGSRAFDILGEPLLPAGIGGQYPDLPAPWLTSRLRKPA